MKSYPKMYRVWLIKNVSGCCDTQKHISYWTPGWSALCPSCVNVVERASHTTLCREVGRRKMLRSSVEELVDWVYTTDNNYTVVMTLSLYPMA